MGKEQVEEITKKRNEIKDIMTLLDKCTSLNPMYKAEVATVIYGNNYRKLPEDSVVLSREEYKKLKQYEEKVENGACFTQKEWLELCDEEYRRETENLLKVRQLERKETAKEILNELIDSSNKTTFFDCRMALGLDKLAKQYGLEIKE